MPAPNQTVRTVAERPLEGVLPALRARDQWVCWRAEARNGTQTKIPVNPRTCGYASVDDETTWTGFETARAVAEIRTDIDGLGFVFTANDPFVGIDLDDCLQLAGNQSGVVPDAQARSILALVESYAEVSPSGTGLHIIATGSFPGGSARADGVEVYDQRRFFTMSGRHLRGTSTVVQRCDDGLATLAEAYLSAGESRESNLEGDGTGTEESEKEHTVDPRTIVELARNASNGAKFERLWNGSTAGYESHSEADMALCTLLAFWTGGDRQLIDRLFRQSGLMRPKWDADRGDLTYGERTIRQALAYVDDYYDISAVESTVDQFDGSRSD